MWLSRSECSELASLLAHYMVLLQQQLDAICAPAPDDMDPAGHSVSQKALGYARWLLARAEAWWKRLRG